MAVCARFAIVPQMEEGEHDRGKVAKDGTSVDYDLIVALNAGVDLRLDGVGRVLGREAAVPARALGL